jgi:hypothetical protein
MNGFLKIWIFVVLLGCFFYNTAQSQEVSVSGNWSLTIDATDLQSGAGSDLIDTYESNTNQVYVSVTKSGGFFSNWYWRVDITKTDGNWPSDFHLDVRRSSDGFGFGGSISGLTSYQEIVNSFPPYFTGNRNRYFIGMQYRLRGVSVQIPPDTYTTTVVYTVTEL